MSSLDDSSRKPLNSLQEELDQLQGRQSDIEQRCYQNQPDNLKAQRAEATAKGDQEAIKNLTSALRLSEQIYNSRITDSLPLSLIGLTVLPQRHGRLCRSPIPTMIINTFLPFDY